MSDVKICGYRLATGPLCHESAGERWCKGHSRTRFLTCVSCGQPANRECPDFLLDAQTRCGVALCSQCGHQSSGLHAPELPPMEIARNELADALVLVLKDAVRRNIISLTEGAELKIFALGVIDQLTTHTTLRVLSGLATPPRD